MIFPCQRIHPREMIYPLEILHPLQSFRLNSTVTPAQIPFIRIIDVWLVRKLEIHHSSHIPNNPILRIQQVDDHTFGSEPLFLDFDPFAASFDYFLDEQGSVPSWFASFHFDNVVVGTLQILFCQMCFASEGEGFADCVLEIRSWVRRVWDIWNIVDWVIFILKLFELLLVFCGNY